MNIGILGTGSYVPQDIRDNSHFESHTFLNVDGSSIKQPNKIIIQKFKSITGINARRYAPKNVNTSDLAFRAAEKAIKDADINKETIDYIIIAHNFGDVSFGKSQGDTLPSLASRVKNLLGIKNPRCVGYDLLFGCPGWIEGVIQANAFIKSGIAKTCLVIGAETLSRVVDDYDRDSMIYADGAGATIISANDASGKILAHASETHANEEAYFLYFGETYNKDINEDRRYIKMHGRKIYEFALTTVPKAMKACLDEAGIDIAQLKKIFIHQANEKMDEAIVQRFYELYGQEVPTGIMPMNIHEIGNTSVATIPTLFDMVKNNLVENHTVSKGDIVLFASVGAGMNINAIVYQM